MCHIYLSSDPGKIYEFKMSDSYPVGPAPSEPGRNGNVDVTDTELDYDDALDWYSEWTCDSDVGVTKEHIDVAIANGDEKLASLLRAWESLSGEIGAHCKAKLASRQGLESPIAMRLREEAQARPGVMINANTITTAFMGVNRANQITGTTTLMELQDRVRTASEKLATTAVKLPTERTCTQFKVGDRVQLADTVHPFSSDRVQCGQLGTVTKVVINLKGYEGAAVKWDNGEEQDGVNNWHVNSQLQFAKSGERVCTQCSKTCDVGLPCWWCGCA